MKILHVAAANSTSGGGEKHVLDCVEQMVARGHEVALAAPSGGDLGTRAQEAGAQYFPLEISHGVHPRQFATLRRIINEFEPDIVHAHGHRAALFARKADSLAGQRVVYTFHGIHVNKGILAPVKTKLERSLIKRTAYFIAVADADVALARKLAICDPSKISVVHNGVPEPKTLERGSFRREVFNGEVNEETPLVLLVARISEQKNLENGALPIFSRVCELAKDRGERLPQLAMICPGSDEQFADLQSKIDALSWHKQFKLFPRRSSLDQAYTDADLFFLPSLWEGSPYVVLEALSYGLPVAAFNLEGIAEAVEDGVSGMLAPCFDNDALAMRIAQTLTSRAQLKAMGAQGKQRVEEQFSLTKMISDILDVYQRVLKARA